MLEALQAIYKYTCLNYCSVCKILMLSCMCELLKKLLVLHMYLSLERERERREERERDEGRERERETREERERQGKRETREEREEGRKIFQTDCKGNSKFNKHCNSIFDMFSKKWNPIVKAEYEATFSIDNWKRLPVNDKKEQSLSFCSACSTNHTQLQKAFPGKPVFYSEQSISLSLPVTPSHSKTEKLEEY